MFRSRWFDRRLLAACLVVVLAVPATGWAQAAGNKSSGDPVLARVNGFAIRGSMVMAQIHTLPPKTQKLPLEKLVPLVVQAIVNARLIEAAADHEHLGDNPQVKRELAVAKNRIVRNVYLEQLVEKAITEPKLHARYEDDIKKMPPQTEIDARHILVKTKREAQAIIRKLEHGASFAKLAKEKSIDPAGKDNGGDLGWFTKDQMVPEFAKAAFALKTGQYTRTPVKTRFGWHVIKVIGRRKAPPPSFDDVKRQLLAQIESEVIGAKIKELRVHAKIEIMGADGKPLSPNSAAALPKIPKFPKILKK
ncbi:MAG: peptidylprolyl isomerase [Stellaceae bacterium]